MERDNTTSVHYDKPQDHLLTTTVSTDHSGDLLVHQVANSNVLQVRNGTDGSFLYDSVHFVSFKPISKPSTSNTSMFDRFLSSFRLAYEAGGYLAAIHLNQRNSSVVPDLEERLQKCSRTDNYLKFTYEMADTQLNRLEALKNLQQVASRSLQDESAPKQQDLLVQQNQLPLPPPTAIIGAASSGISMALSSLSGVYELPQVSGLSSAAALDDKTKTPYFSRLYPSNEADARALVLVLKEWGVTHFGLVYGRDLYGTAFGGGVLGQASALGIEVYETAYEIDDLESLQNSLQYLQSTNVRYVFGIYHANSWKAAFEMAYGLGIMGHPGYTWLLSDNTNQITSSEFALSKEDETGVHNHTKLALAIDGTGVLTADFYSNPILETIVAEDLAKDVALQQDFVAAHRDNTRYLFRGYDWINDPPQPSNYVDLVYDAVIATGLAACELVASSSSPFFTGAQLLQQIRNQEFQGSTGHVQLNNTTGTRDAKGLRYKITNVLLLSNNNTAEEVFRFEAEPKISIELSPAQVLFNESSPYTFVGGTTNVPNDLPPLIEDRNLIPQEFILTAWLVCGVLVFAALICTWFVKRNRHKQAVSSAQPLFLVFICVGTIFIAATIVPMSFQDRNPIDDNSLGLDIACMSTVYVFSIGFVVVFSSLFCKTWRLNRIFKSATRFRRVQIQAQDVLRPLLLLMSINLSILIAWSIVDPLKWTRFVVEDGGFDIAGRATESYAVCASENPTLQKVFTSLYAIPNLVALVLANWECYKARKLPEKVNETDRIAAVMFILLECAVLGIPVLFVVKDNPTASFCIRTIIIAVICIAILVPLFLPLWRDVRSEQVQRRTVVFSSASNFATQDCSVGSGRPSFWQSSRH